MTTETPLFKQCESTCNVWIMSENCASTLENFVCANPLMRNWKEWKEVWSNAKFWGSQSGVEDASLLGYDAVWVGTQLPFRGTCCLHFHFFLDCSDLKREVAGSPNILLFTNWHCISYHIISYHRRLKHSVWINSWCILFGARFTVPLKCHYTSDWCEWPE